MKIFGNLFGGKSKQSVMEQLAGAKAELAVHIRQESMLKYVDSTLFCRIGKLSAKVASLQARLDFLNGK